MKYWNKRLQKMTEYIPGEQPDNLNEFIKLNTNENPFPPSSAVLDALQKACNGDLRRYPNPNAQMVRELFAKKNSLAADNVFVANGSDEIFTLLFRGFIEPDGIAAFPYPSYALYYTMAEANGIAYDKITLDDNFDIPFDEFLKKKYNLVIIANPNNPTGKGVPIDQIKKFCSKFKGLLVVDEAYVDFYNETALPLVKEFDNIVITRSFSKSYSLAGLRVGLAIAHKEIIHGFIKLKDSYNVDRIAQAGAYVALLDDKGFKYNISMVRNNKEYLEESLEALGFINVPSRANFVFTKHPDIDARTLYEKLKEQKILVRYFAGPIQSEYIRISVGTMMEIKKLIKVLSEIISG
ncbi:MAG TPA: histidinol-phosphate transaminase [Spirochaetota bacterium]|nr:histidinol-phosphate transaminase [Spirochaetota bacterium]